MLKIGLLFITIGSIVSMCFSFCAFYTQVNPEYKIEYKIEYEIDTDSDTSSVGTNSDPEYIIPPTYVKKVKRNII